MQDSKLDKGLFRNEDQYSFADCQALKRGDSDTAILETVERNERTFGFIPAPNIYEQPDDLARWGTIAPMRCRGSPED